MTPELSKWFPNLRAAPIVEAVIHWQARSAAPWEPDALKAALAERLPEYPRVEWQHQHEIAIETQTAVLDQNRVTTQTRSWHGLRLHHASEPYVAQFTRDGLVFSRLKPYRDWDSFESEARRLWRLFVDLAAPEMIERLGVRFINRIEAANFANLADYLKEPPCLSGQLKLAGFLYHSQFAVPGDNLRVNVIKAMQPANSGLAGLILDIDVFTDQASTCDDGVIHESLRKMRSLKNMVFFDLLKPTAIDTFR